MFELSNALVTDTKTFMIKQFQKYLTNWYHHYGRHDLPWRETIDPYAIWVSEVMLQQTQVERVIPKYQRWLKLFPTVSALAQAPRSKVITQWQGLGYNRRGLNLHKAAQQVVSDFSGRLPDADQALLSLAGIGPYTAAAIQVFAFNQPRVVIETNIRTVYLYHFFQEHTQVTDQQLTPVIADSVLTTNPRQWYSALMDYGSHLKSVLPNPSRRSKHHTKQSKFHGSPRQVRGQILRLLAQQPTLKYQQLRQNITGDVTYLDHSLLQLKDEGFIQYDQDQIKLQ